MGIAYVQSTKTYFNASSGSIAFASNVATNGLLIATLHRYGGGGLDSTTLSDSYGNSYSHIYGTNGSLGLEIWYARNSTSGSNKYTITLADVTYCSAAIHEFSGAVTSGSLLDQVDSNTGTGTDISGGPITTTQADEMLFGAMTSTANNLNVITPDADYTQMEEYENGSTEMHLSTMYRIVSSTLTDTANWTIAASKAWIGYILSFKAAGSTPPAVSYIPLNNRQRSMHLLIR
jgi:hypothetical protein